MSTTTSPPRASSTPPSQRSNPVRRLGDRVFTGLSTGSGIAILAILALVAGFLVMQAFPALTTAPDKLKSEGYGEFWSWVAPFAFGTVWASFLALLFAVPVSLGIALFISHYLLAAVPSVVFGLWGANVFATAMVPVYDWLSTYLGFIPLFAPPSSGTGRTILTAALVLAIMVLPIITSLCREIFLQTPKLHEEAALALGATRWEMARMAVFPFARAGIVSAVMLGLGRALGETMAVAMVLSGSDVITFNVVGSQNPNTIASTIALNFPEAFGLRINQLIAAGLVLFIITLVVNMVARWIVSRRAEFSGAN